MMERKTMMYELVYMKKNKEKLPPNFIIVFYEIGKATTIVHFGVQVCKCARYVNVAQPSVISYGFK